MQRINFAAMGTGIAILIATLTGLNPASAQNPATAPSVTMSGRHENPLALALKAADLTAAQKGLIKPISKKYRDERKAIMQGGMPTGLNTGTRPKITPELRAKLADSEAREVAEIKAILTPDQAAKFQSAYDSAKLTRAAGTIMTRFTAELTLTPDQQTKITPIMADVETEAAKLRADPILQRRDRATKMAGVWSDAKVKIRPLLTPDQQRILDGMKGLRGGNHGGNSSVNNPVGAIKP